MKDFRKLQVWERAHGLALRVYKASAGFPKEEIYGLTAQVRRPSVSIASNIAEGCGRNSDADFARMLQIAMGSASETEYQLLLSRDLGFLDTEGYGQLQVELEEVKRMLSGLLKTLRSPSRQPAAES